MKEKKDVLPHRLAESDFSLLQLRQTWPAGHCLVLRSIRFSQNLHIFSMILWLILPEICHFALWNAKYFFSSLCCHVIGYSV